MGLVCEGGGVYTMGCVGVLLVGRCYKMKLEIWCIYVRVCEYICVSYVCICEMCVYVCMLVFEIFGFLIVRLVYFVLVCLLDFGGDLGCGFGGGVSRLFFILF